MCRIDKAIAQTYSAFRLSAPLVRPRELPFLEYIFAADRQCWPRAERQGYGERVSRDVFVGLELAAHIERVVFVLFP